MGRVSERVRNPAVEAGADLRIHLLGAPTVQRGGVEVEAPPGRKHWGLLTYLVRTEVPSSRERLSALLFPEADDPLGALRSALWRPSAASSARTPRSAAIPSGWRSGRRAIVDVEILRKGSWLEATSLPGLGHELLDGMAFRSSPGFENWLENERRHVAGTTAAVLHEAALALLARGDVDTARGHAAHLVRLNAVRRERARAPRALPARRPETPTPPNARSTACTSLFRKELGIEPSHGPRLGGGGATRLGRDARLGAVGGERPHRDRHGRR